MSVISDLDNLPRRCIYAAPVAGAPTRIEFRDVHFGATLHGHHGLWNLVERDLSGPIVRLRFITGDSILATLEHRDGDGWAGFELDTSALAGQTGELTAEVSSEQGPQGVLLRGRLRDEAYRKVTLLPTPSG